MDYSGLDAARNTAQTTAQTAVDYSSAGANLADELRKALSARFDTSNIAQEGATARGNFMAAAPQARTDILGMINNGTILSPTQQDAILSAKRSAALVPVMANNTLSDAAFGTMQDLINAGVGAWDKQVTAATGAASLADNNYKNLLQELVTRQGLDQNAIMNPLDILLKKAQIASANRANAGGDTSLQLTTLGDNAYTFNPKTGKLEVVPGVSTTKTKFTEDELATYANAISSGGLTIAQIPQAARGQVQTMVDEQYKMQHPIISGIKNFLSGN